MKRCKDCGHLFRADALPGRPRVYCSECRPGGAPAPPLPEGADRPHDHVWLPSGATKTIGGVEFEMDACAVPGCGEGRARRPEKMLDTGR